MTREYLFEMLALYGGAIVSTASLDVKNIEQARASGRMWVDENSLGFVWMPGNFSNGPFPETPEEVELFEKWFPLDEELPDPQEMWERIQKSIKINNQMKNN